MRLLIFSFLLLACDKSEDDGGTGGRNLRELQVDPNDVSMVAGGTAQLRAKGFFDNGNIEDFTNIASWRTDRDAVATVDEAGLVTAHGEGMATISALASGLRGMATIRVFALELQPMQVDLRPGETVQFNAANIPAMELDWSSSDPAVVEVDPIGIARAVGSGTAQVIASSGGVSASASVTVEPVLELAISPERPFIEVGRTTPLFARATFADNFMTDLTSVVEWSSSAPSFTVSNELQTKGMATRVSAESATITAAFEDRIASVRLPATCSDVVVDGLIFESLGGQAVGMMKADADNIYWYDYDRFTPALGVLRWVPKRNGSQLALVSGLSGVDQFVVDDTHVYWKESPNGQDQILRRVPKMSVETEILWSSIGLGGGGGGVAVDEAHVYWADGAAARVHRMPKGGGTVEDLGNGNFSGPSILVDDEWVYVATREQAESVRRAHKTDGRVETLATGLLDVRLYAVDSEAVYAVERSAVVAIALDGSGSRILATLQASGGVHIGVDDTHVYFPERTYPAVSRVPKRGGPIEIMVDSCENGMQGQGFAPISMLPDQDRIYVIDFAGSIDHRARLLAAPK